MEFLFWVLAVWGGLLVVGLLIAVLYPVIIAAAVGAFLIVIGVPAWLVIPVGVVAVLWTYAVFLTE